MTGKLSIKVDYNVQRDITTKAPLSFRVAEPIVVRIEGGADDSHLQNAINRALPEDNTIRSNHHLEGEERVLFYKPKNTEELDQLLHAVRNVAGNDLAEGSELEVIKRQATSKLNKAAQIRQSLGLEEGPAIAM